MHLEGWGAEPGGPPTVSTCFFGFLQSGEVVVSSVGDVKVDSRCKSTY